MTPFLLPLILALAIVPSSSQQLSSTLVSAVRDRLAEAAQASWELGTRAQALLELDTPSYSVFSHNSLPPPSSIPSSVVDPIKPVLSIAKSIVGNRSTSNDGISGPQPLIRDGSAADPASNGVAILIANWTGQNNVDHFDYGGAATDQLNYLYQVVPKTSDGAISHRVSEVQLWSDFIYMVPPFLAYYGVTTRDHDKLLDAYNQISLYRNYLRDPGTNMWKHVVLGSWSDEGFWSTGNGWAAAGMLRVLSTIQRSEFSKSLKKQQVDLANWVKEIHSGIYPHLDNNQLFRNYANNSSTFYDASSTALLASTVYRLSVLAGDHSHIPLAEASRKAISANPTSGGGTQHITADGVLFPVVNPYRFGEEGSKSAEGQAFVLEMLAAWRDWVAAGSKGVNGGGSIAGRAEMRLMVPVAVGAAVMLS